VSHIRDKTKEYIPSYLAEGDISLESNIGAMYHKTYYNLLNN
jgi:hypothetical protein